MLSLDRDDLYKEIKYAMEERDAVIAGLNKMIARMHGPGYRAKAGTEETSVNLALSWLSIFLPRLIHNNPKTMVSAREAIDGDQDSVVMAARSLQAFLNSWVKTAKLNKKMRLCARDYGFMFCCGMVTREKHPGDPSQDMAVDRYVPEFQRIPVWRMIVDPECESLDEARYIGHVWYADHDDLKKFAEDDPDEWNEEAINAMKPGRVDPMSVGTEAEGEDSIEVDRNQVVCIDLWIPEMLSDDELGPEDGFHGTILTLGFDKDQNTTQFIREPAAYYGPPTGPYAMGGWMSVMKSPFPLGPIAAARGHEDLLRKMVNKANKACADYKRIVLVPTGTKTADAARKVVKSDEYIIEVPGLAQNVKPEVIEVGGITDQQIKNMAHLERQLELVTGMNATIQGNADGEGSATEEAIAESGMQVRQTGIVDPFHEYVGDILDKVAWYGFHDEDVEQDITEAIEGMPPMNRPVFRGGAGDLDPRIFDTWSIDIEPMSMPRSSDQMHQRRVLQMLQLVGQLVPLIRAYPEVDWESVLDKLGDALNMPDLGTIIDFQQSNQLFAMGLTQAPTSGSGTSAGLNPGSRREVQGTEQQQAPFARFQQAGMVA